MRMFLVIPLILLGAIFLGLRIDNIGNLGNVTLNIVGVGFMLLSVFIGNVKKKKQKFLS
ncbi:serine kinase [Cytobacillus suaedae]|nr:serine kinase [Cytobacillus suaedae]